MVKEKYIKTIGIIILLALAMPEGHSQGTEVPFSSIPRNGTILINSHMDDDAIWMLPFWGKTEKFICGAMPATPAFRAIISEQQVFINNNNYNIDYLGNWYTPWDDITDREYMEYYLGDEPDYQYLRDDHLEARLWNNPTPLSRQEINKLKAKIEQYIADPSTRRIITHNNWGEYGHLHHIGLNRAVRELAVKYRKDVWMLGCDNGGFYDVFVPNGITFTYGSFNQPNLFVGIRTAYQNHGLWTWYDDYIPSGDHKFIKIVDAGSDKSYILKGDEITSPGPYQLEPGSYIFDGDDDFMTLKGNNNSSFTIMMRIRPDMIGAMDISAMAEYPGSDRNDRNIFMTGSGQISARIFDGSSKTVTSSAQVAAGTWNHVAITGNGSEFRLYVNGILDKTITAGNAITNYVTPELVLGLATRTSNNFAGQIHDVRMLNRAMSETEIAIASGMVVTISSSAGAGGTITPSGNVSVPLFSNQTFTITPAAGYNISDVIVDNISIGPVNSYTFTSVTSDHTISASFTQATGHTVVATAGEGGTIDPSGNVTVYEGTSRTFTIRPTTGYKIADVLVDGISIGQVSSYTFNNITGDHVITATFETTPTYTLTATAGEGGMISPAGTLIVNEASDQTFTITPEDGYRIRDVRVDGSSIGPVGTYTFHNITAGHTISALFEIITYTITGSAGDGGSISPSGTLTRNHGSSQTFTFHPETGYRIADVRVDGTSVGTPSEYRFNNIRADHTISVSFSIIVNTISATAGNGGSISPRGNVSVRYGNSQTFSISADQGYFISDVKADNVSQGPISSYTFSNVTSNHSITAEFLPSYHTITASAGTGGTISPSGSTTVDRGSSRTYSITPGTGYRIADVRVDNSSVGAVSSYTFENITSNHTITATFSIITFNITANPGSGGSVTPPGNNTVDYGSSVTFSITPNQGYSIRDVQADNVSVGPVSTYTFNNVTSDHAISATFEINRYTITASASQGGTVTPSGTATVTYGSQAVYNMNPSRGYKVSDVLIDNVSAGAVSSYTFRNISSNHSLEARFEPITFTISASAGRGGSITPAGSTTANYGSDVTYVINPDYGYRVSNVNIDRVSSGPLSSFTFQEITANHSIEATFTLLTYNITIESTGGGSVSPAGPLEISHGSGIEVTFSPDPGYKVSDVKVNGTSIGKPESWSLESVTADQLVSVKFEPIPTYTIEASTGPGGSISPTGSAVVIEDSGQAYTISPDPGYMILDVTVDNKSVGPVTEYVFTGVSSNHSIRAEFTSQTIVRAYPNPFLTHFSLFIASPEEGEFDLIISDTSGKIVLSESKVPANTEIILSPEVSDGIYLVKIYQGKKLSKYIKMVKNK